ncbi:copper resistance protein CopC [Nocardioides carbamazepini]|uniref:copper resistance CopC family protein n=1 Tax=Nocardioides carbamazepini TaxID=2854259 RepID=UPI002149DA2D|nr:copper resistance protein CopC [Nocardioides carbamazepini]MCR1784380.1 copper resistance protein CopC [Nocardioides carbamazepini]
MRKHARSAALVAAVGTALVAVLAAGWSLPAAAHASLVGSDPDAGQRFERLPGQAQLEFSEPISAPAYVVVTAPDGSRADQGEARIDGGVVTVDLGGAAPEGTYGLAFRVVSEDGHPVTGRIAFVVGDGPLDDTLPSAPAASTTPDAGTDRTPAARDEVDDGGPSLGQVQVGVAVALFAVAGGLLLWSRRRPR